MRAYTSNDLQSIISAAHKIGLDQGRTLHRDAPMPDPPTVQEVVDHPFHSSDAPGQYKRPWLNDPRGQRGLVHSKKEVTHEAAKKEGES